MNTDHELTGANRAQGKPKRTPKAPRQTETLLDPRQRAQGCDEVNRRVFSGASAKRSPEMPELHAPKCIAGLPPPHRHPAFRRSLIGLPISQGRSKFILERSPFPGICGRVCQHELFCEKVLPAGEEAGTGGDRFAGALSRRISAGPQRLRGGPALIHGPTAPRVALIGSGPASLIAAYDLVRKAIA